MGIFSDRAAACRRRGRRGADDGCHGAVQCAAAAAARAARMGVPGRLDRALPADGGASRRVYRLGTQESRNALMLYYVQLAVHFVWPLLYFRAQEYEVAFWWLLLLLALVLAALSAFSCLDKAAGRLLMPYAAWLLFAAYLNYSMIRIA